MKPPVLFCGLVGSQKLEQTFMPVMLVPEPFATWKQLGTPEAKSAYDREIVRMDRHISWRAMLFIGGFILVDGILFYYGYLKNDTKKTVA